MNVLQLDCDNTDTGLIAVHNLLQQVHGLHLDFQLARGQRAIDLVLADNFAHGGLGGAFHGFHGIIHVEQIIFGVFYLELDDELHVDNVFVAGQHQGFIRHKANISLVELAPPSAGTEADFDTLNFRNARRLHAFQRKGM